MIVVAICDDDQNVQGILETILLDIGKKHKQKIEIEIFADGIEILRRVKEGQRFDIIFMDIKMETMNGIDAAQQIREWDKFAQIIFVTAYETYMRKAIEVAPIGFISKPIKEIEMERSFKRAMKYIEGQDEYYRFDYKGNGYRLQIKDILYFQSNGRKVDIICNENIFCKYGKILEVEEQLARCKCQFFRTHRHYLVNWRHVHKFTYDKVSLKNGVILPISQTYRNPLKFFVEH